MSDGLRVHERPIILASASPRRLDLLRRLGLHPQVIAADIDEAQHEGEHPVDYARRVALAKAVHVASRLSDDALVLAADTTVWSPRYPSVFGKAADRAQAKAMLTALASLAEHQVTTAWVLIDVRDRRSLLDHTTTRVHMRPLLPGELDRYLDGGEWQDKAGAYAIQGDALTFIDGVYGNLGAVIGLPVDQVATVLRQFCTPSRAQFTALRASSATQGPGAAS